MHVLRDTAFIRRICASNQALACTYHQDDAGAGGSRMVERRADPSPYKSLTKPKISRSEDPGSAVDAIDTVFFHLDVECSRRLRVN